MAEIYNRTLVEAKAAMLLIPQSARVLAKNKMVFVSESIENIAPGWRARETYLILNENEFIERFELAEPGKDFVLYSEAHLKRTR